jgi:hypothetical protein
LESGAGFQIDRAWVALHRQWRGLESGAGFQTDLDAWAALHGRVPAGEPVRRGVRREAWCLVVMY